MAPDEADARARLTDLERQWAGAPGWATSTAMPVGRMVPTLLLVLRELVDRLEALEAVAHDLAPEARAGALLDAGALDAARREAARIECVADAIAAELTKQGEGRN